MPRKSKGGGRGGVREGTPGTAYSNRTDLNAPKTQPIRTAPSATYGDAAASARAQSALPLPGPGAGVPSPPATGSGPSGAGGPSSPPPAPAALPGQLGPLTAPTSNPNQPITAGLSSGPGPGPEALGMPAQPTDPTVALLQGVLSQYPNADLRALVLEAESR